MSNARAVKALREIRWASKALLFLIPIAVGGLVWLFWREWLTSDRFWIAVAAVLVASSIWRQGEPEIALAITAIGVGVWLWLDRRDHDG